MVMIAMMHRQLLQIDAGKLARAAPAHPWIQLESALTIALFAQFRVAPRFGDNAIQSGVIGSFSGHDQPARN